MENKKALKKLTGFTAWLLAAVLLLSGCSAEKPDAPRVPREPEIVESPVQEDGEADSETDGDVHLSAPEAQAPPEEPAEAEPLETEFVRVADCVPEIAVELRYATENNFTGQAIYDFSDAYLRYGTVKKLAAAQETLAEQGYGLKIWDAFRPPAAQFALWEVCPDGRYVSDPNKGFSSHSRGNTVDVTLVGADGEELLMPTGFDDFSSKADRDYSDADPAAAENALLLENAMTEAGFRPYSGEWWHFSDTDGYDVETAFIPEDDE